MIRTDQQRCFVSIDHSEPQLHVSAAAAFRVRPDDDVLLSSAVLKDQNSWFASDTNIYSRGLLHSAAVWLHMDEAVKQ